MLDFAPLKTQKILNIINIVFKTQKEAMVNISSLNKVAVIYSVAALNKVVITAKKSANLCILITGIVFQQAPPVKLK